MSNNNEGKFSTGFLIGLLIGGGAVFLLGTRTGKNLLKIISDQGFDGLVNLMEEYGLDDLEEYEEVENEEEADIIKEHHVENEQVKSSPVKTSGQEKQTPKKRFFKRVRR